VILLELNTSHQKLAAVCHEAQLMMLMSCVGVC